MTQSLFIFSAKGVATEATRYRPGAQHALLLYGRGSGVEAARSAAVAGAEDRGWNFVEVQRQKELDADLSAIEDETLRSAAQDASRLGYSMIVYRDELPLDG
ncbi:hypothetical protein [Novosphingobium decolorationis]|uniref:Uncharacterized protein n=1 Tax=Novosphingobium decolorationis TaxID=2698673 RepID=A0ABX8EB12_9SPHN|nr:hypothetical protein [Novosphingobium decolorationis]QVM85221.1 hypothetical protein HT578_17340 [Novosphingobium decolorationis]